jgi:D-threo-aldose 1-dehydrogenase
MTNEPKFPKRRIARTGLFVSELGFGAASLGNLYQPISNVDARATLEAAIEAGLDYVDTAPHYGFGLSERRVGDVLRGRDDFVLSTKVGRLLMPLPDHRGDAERFGFRTPMPFEPRFDYSYDAIMKSWEQSLQRLGLARIDILYVHDIGRVTHGDRHDETFAQLTAGGGLRALEELRRDGQISAFGLGVNEWEIGMDVMDHVDLDVILLAGRYTLLEQDAIDPFLSLCVERDVSIVIGGAFNSGILATGTRGSGTAFFNYEPAPPPILDRVRRIEAVCDRFGVTLAAAALRFPLAHPSVVSVIPGLGNVRRVQQTLALYHERIPQDFWTALREAGLLRPDVPVPVETA